jgi:small-conductance mechanosensitive channel
MNEQSEERNLRDNSDRLLAEVREIQAMEREKRSQEVSTPEFHDLSDSIVDKSREVFRIAAEEQDTGEAMEHRPGRTVNDL